MAWASIRRVGMAAARLVLCVAALGACDESVDGTGSATTASSAAASSTGTGETGGSGAVGAGGLGGDATGASGGAPAGSGGDGGALAASAGGATATSSSAGGDGGAPGGAGGDGGVLASSSSSAESSSSVASSASSAASSSAASSSSTGGGGPLRVLFVGNSFTFEDDVPGQVQALSVAMNEAVALEVGMVATPSQTLQGHYEVGDVEAALDAATWDIVVLQEHHTMPFDAEATFYQYATLLDASIKAHGAQTMFYMTWVEQDQTAADQDIVESSYLGIAQQVGADVAPVGVAWKNAFAAQPTLVLHDLDGFHSNEKGSYLAACVFYAALYGKSPVGAPSPNAGVGADAAFLQTTAWTTWQGGTWNF